MMSARPMSPATMTPASAPELSELDEEPETGRREADAVEEKGDVVLEYVEAMEVVEAVPLIKAKYAPHPV